jgi:hypothetical protein
MDQKTGGEKFCLFIITRKYACALQWEKKKAIKRSTCSFQLAAQLSCVDSVIRYHVQ